jgi:hypothetical protein
MVDNNDDSFGNLDADDGESGDGSKFNCIVDGIRFIEDDCAALRPLHRYPVSVARLI